MRFIPILLIVLFLAAGCERNRVSYKTVDLPAPEEVDRLVQAVTYRVNDYGAVADGVTDCGPAIQSALDAALMAGPGARVVFGEGQYKVRTLADEANKYAFVVRGAKGLTIEGQGLGTEIILADPRAAGFVFLEGEGIVIRDLVYDHDPLPFTQGEILAIEREAGWIDVEIDPGFPMPDEPWFMDPLGDDQRWGMVFDPEKRRLKGSVPDFIMTTRAEYNGEGRSCRFYLRGGEAQKLAGVSTGDLWAQIIRPPAAGCLFFWRTLGCKVQNVVLRAGPSIGVVGYASDALEVRDSAVVFQPGSPRLVTLNADAFHFQQARVGPTVDSCYVEGIADDAVAINCPPVLPLAQLAPDVVDVQNSVFIEQGDILEFFNPRQGLSRGRRIATEVMPVGGDRYRIRLSDRIDGLVLGGDPRTADHVQNMSRMASGFRISNNRLQNHRRHGMLIQAENGSIEGNTIEGVGGFGIVVANDPDWPLGGVPSRIEIRGNLIRNAGNEKWYGDRPNGAALIVRATALGDKTAAERLANGFVIEDNRIVNPPGAGMLLGGVDGAILRGNVVAGLPDHSAPRIASAYEFQNCANVQMIDNGASDTRRKTISAVRIDEWTAAGDGGVVVRGLEANLASASVEVIDLRPGADALTP